MKRHLNIAMAIIILAGAFTAVAHAQTTSTQRVLADIPFGFNVGKTNLPAGKYTITVLNPTSDQKVLQIRSTNGRSSATVLTTSIIGNTSDDAKLVFHRYGNLYFFAQVQLAGDRISLAAVKSSAEREEKRALAASGKKSVVVIIAE
jgi:hypothetical protein